MTAAHPAVLDFPVAAPPAAGEAFPIAPGILWLRLPLPFALDHVNVWLLEDGDGFTLVDTGICDAATRALWDGHFARTLGGRPIARIVATHCHPDHLGNAAWLAERFGCPVAMTAGEFLTAHSIIDEYATHAPHATAALFARHGLARADVDAMLARGNRFRDGVPVAPATYERIQGGDRLTIGGNGWTVIAGFGHSTEHASLFCAAHNVLVSGDMLLPKISTNVSVWPAEPEADPVGRFLDSLTTFDSLPPSSLVLPSHGLPFRGIPLRVAQLRAHHELRLAELRQAVAAAPGPVNAAEMMPVLFPRPLDQQQRYFAIGETIAHLNHLWRRGRLTRSRDAQGDLRFAA